MAAKLPAAIYARISGQDDERTASIDTQVDGCKAKAKTLGYSLPDAPFVDRMTGTELYERPSLGNLRQAIREGRYKAIFIYALDRLARKLAHQAILFEEAERFGVEIISATEEIDKTPEGDLIRSVKGYVAEVEREKILERTQRGTRKTLAEGKVLCSGKAKYGYKFNKELRTREVDPEQEKVVKQIFQWACEGDSARTIVKKLTAAGIPSPMAHYEFKVKEDQPVRQPKWGRSTVLSILRDDSYMGGAVKIGKSKATRKTRDEIEESKRRTGNATVRLKKQVRLKPDEWQPMTGNGAQTPRIIDPEVWEDANVKIKKRNGYSKTRNQTHPRLLRGMIVCGVCGRTMTPHFSRKRDGSRNNYYVCMSRYSEHPTQEGNPTKSTCSNGGTPAEWAENLVWEEIVSMIAKPDVMEAKIREALDAATDPSIDADREVHVGEIRQAEAKVKRLMTAFADEEDETVGAALKEKVDALKGSIKLHREALAEIDSRLSVRDNKAKAFDDFKQFMEKARRRLQGDLTFEQRRELLEALAVKVIAQRKALTVQVVDVASSPCGAIPSSKGRKFRGGLASSGAGRSPGRP